MTLPMPDTRSLAQSGILNTRHLTRAGNYPNLVVLATHTSVDVTFVLPEGDVLYGVHAVPSWDTTVWVTDKTLTGCTIHFGTMAPVSATVDVSTFRSENTP